jgi:hypothetical protein
MKTTIKATIKTPSNWLEMSGVERNAYLDHALQTLAARSGAGLATEKTILDRNGNTVAVEVKL